MQNSVTFCIIIFLPRCTDRLFLNNEENGAKYQWYTISSYSSTNVFYTKNVQKIKKRTLITENRDKNKKKCRNARNNWHSEIYLWNCGVSSRRAVWTN